MDRLKETLDYQAELAADPDYNHAGWRLGVSDNVLDEVWERHERAMFDRELQTTNYIRENWEPGDRLALVYIDRRNGNQVTQKIKTAEEIVAVDKETNERKFMAHLRASNANAKDIYVGMNPLNTDATGRKKSDIAVIRNVYLDIDNGGREAVKRILETPKMPAPNNILESSPGKFQVIWRVEGFSPPEAEKLMRDMVPAYSADPAATDSTRILRLPGFRTYKYPQPHYVRDLVAHEERSQARYTPSDFPRFSEQQIRSQATGQAVNAGTGTQSHKDWAWANQQYERGRNPEVIIRELIAMRQDKANPEYYARHTMQEVLKRSHKQGQSVGISQY